MRWNTRLKDFVSNGLKASEPCERARPLSSCHNLSCGWAHLLYLPADTYAAEPQMSQNSKANIYIWNAERGRLEVNWLYKEWRRAIYNLLSRFTFDLLYSLSAARASTSNFNDCQLKSSPVSPEGTAAESSGGWLDALGLNLFFRPSQNERMSHNRTFPWTLYKI